MSGQMKTLIDRMNAMYELDYQFRDVYLLTTAADDDEQTPKRAENGLGGWIACYPESRLAGTVFCGSVNEPHAIEDNPKLQEAFDAAACGYDLQNHHHALADAEACAAIALYTL